jgi:hypothetical protein
MCLRCRLKEPAALLSIFVNTSGDSRDMKLSCRSCARIWFMFSLVLLVYPILLCVGVQRFSAGAPLVKSKSKLRYRRSAGQSVLEQSTHLGLTTRS